jgi:hypothetical protein
MSEVKVGTSRSSIYNLQVPNDDNLSADQTTDTDFVTRIGKKADAAATGAVTSTDSIMAYLKQIVTESSQGGILVSGANLTDLTTGTVFTIAGGNIKVKELFGVITTDIEAQATTTKVVFTSSRAGATATDVCATADLNAKTDGTMLRVTGDFSEALVVGPDGDDLVEADTIEAAGFILGAGAVNITFGAASTGAITWYMIYESYGGVVTGSTTEPA